MAFKLSHKFMLFALTLAMLAALLPSPALADGQVESSSLKTHTIKFYLDPALAAGLGFAKMALPKYVNDMNAILAKNTNRRLLFDAETGIIIAESQPHTDSAMPPLPTEDFEIWAHAVHTDQAVSYGGYAGMDASGAGALAGLRWTRLYDPDALAPNEVWDYTTQLDHMLHELAHVLGAGIGEYYSLMSVTDTTGVAPLMDINIANAKDPFWSDKPDFMRDPLLRFTETTSRAQYLSTVQFSNLTAAVMNGSYRNGIPSFEQFTVQVLDESGQPASNVNVRVWNVEGVYPYASQLLLDAATNANGQVMVAWGTSTGSHNANNFLRLIKVYRDGTPVAAPRYVSIYDADIAALVKMNVAQAITIQLAPQTQSAAFASIAAKDGWTLEAGENANTGKTKDTAASALRLGDDAGRAQYRGILSFDTSSLPDNAVVTKFMLQVKKQGVTGGGNPLNLFRGFLADIRNGAFGASSLESADWQSPAHKTLGPFTPALVNGWYALDLSAAATQVNKSMGGLTQIRLRFKLDDNNNAAANYLTLFSGNAAAANRPQLIVEYHVP